MAGIRSHEDLVAWQLADDLETRVFEITARSKIAKDGDFCDDIRRSTKSAPANLSEGFYRFRPRDNARFVRIALGSLGETLNHLHHAHKHAYISDEEFRSLTDLANRAKAAATGWVNYLDSCPPEGPKKKDSSKPPQAGPATPGTEPSPEPEP